MHGRSVHYAFIYPITHIMLEYIRGDVASLTPTDVVIDCGGVGYRIEISLNTFDGLRDRTSAKVLVHEVIREDAHLLFGFSTERERALFRLLLGVSGVGANTARTILSALTPSSLEQAIAGGETSTLKSVKGIGAKTAERIIVDLRDKIKAGDSTLINVAGSANQSFDEALAALVMLGFQRQPSQKVLRKIFDQDPTASVESAIKKALSMM